MEIINTAVQRLLTRYPKLWSTYRILKSFLPWCAGRRKPPKGGLPIKATRQWTEYSCTAAVAQMVAAYYGIKVGHRKAIELTKCKPDGATLEYVARMLNRQYGLTPKALRTIGQIRKALVDGHPVMSNDALTYTDDHAILLVGQTPKGFWIADPAVCEIYWRREDKFKAGAHEFIAIIGEIPAPKLRPRLRPRRL